ncbi:hypothetical protein [Helicobacter pylori]|uniref:hypothetical protein n=1 Tax=Helicobacter pylori TaxID=210 RepID=UPI00095848A8|nr:hypothetical protein [Helicobacter pylori]BAW72026.1 uncharacterized protein HPMKF3_0791 [Helicobacter pylori]
MEKILAFFIPSFFIPSFFIPSFFIPSLFSSLFSSLSGGGGYKPTLNLLESPKSLAFFKSLVFGVEP